MVTEIADQRIGPGHAAYVIAEAGVNHNGDIQTAFRLVDAALEAGASAVKWQTWHTSAMLPRDHPRYAELRALELPWCQFAAIQEYCDQRGITFLSTPDHAEAADYLDSLNVPAFKMGSGALTNLRFLRHVARKGRPMIVSTGMGDMGQVDAAVRSIEAAGNTSIVPLHCVSAYPAKVPDCNLAAMGALARFGYPVGFSDHTLSVLVPAVAVAMGACVVEKHLTLDRTMAGPDHAASLEPWEFAEMVRHIRLVEQARGDGVKRMVEAERATAEYVESWRR